MRTSLILLAVLAAGCKRGAPPVALPEMEDACATDEDCAWDWMMLVDARCCSTCDPQPSSKKHVDEVRAACKTIGFSPTCLLKKCKSPPLPTCLGGHCVSTQ